MRTMTAFEDELETEKDTELTLGLPSLLGIFFGIVLICGVFFGFGYSLGRRNLPDRSAAQPVAQPIPSGSTAALPKPSAQTPPAENTQALADSSTVPQATSIAPETARQPAPVESAAPQIVVRTQPAEPVPDQPAKATKPFETPLQQPLMKLAPIASGSIMVQVAAVSRQEDANALVRAVRKDGFNATLRSEAQDRLYHVQVGPFATRDEAKAMRQKLADAGYNAFIK